MESNSHRDIVVLGASAGGVEPLKAIASSLQADVPAAFFVVLHLPPGTSSSLPEILDRSGPLAAVPAEDAMPIEHGKIYVAPPDYHLSLEKDKVRVLNGPTENRHRPSVDVLFRSAARIYGPRVVGVVLSGSLDDGTAGLIAVKVRGGLTVVQDPAEAFSDQMPRNAMRYIEVDHVLKAAQIGPHLNLLTRQLVSAKAAAPPTPEMVQENGIAKLDRDALESEEKPGVQSVISCPDCHGVLWEIQEGGLLRFRCRTGHAYSPETLISAENDSVEAALWEALRTLEERIALRRRLIRQAKERNLTSLAAQFEKSLSESVSHVEALRSMLLQKAEKVAT